MAYTSVAEIKLLLNIESEADDALLAMLILAVQDSINEHTGQSWEGVASARTFDAQRDVEGRTLYVYRAGPLSSIASITNGDGATVTSSEYHTQPQYAAAEGKPIYAIHLHDNSSVYWRASTTTGYWEDAITVTGVWAAASQAPQRIRQAAREYVSWAYRRARNPDPDIDRPIVSPDGSVLLPSQLPGHVKELLKAQPTWI
jgi:hypothetical protein